MQLPARCGVLLTLLYLVTSSLAQSVSIVSTEIVAATVTITEAAPTQPLSASYTDSTDLRTSALNSTNFYRYEHSADFVYWNSTLASYAQSWANKCQWEHSHGPYGENLAQGYVDTTASVDAWGNERALYSWKGDQTGFTEQTGHFTQLVWKSTRSVGCAAVNCHNVAGSNIQGVFLVCEYEPAGNVVGENNLFFVDNVGQQVNSGAGFNVASATNPATITGTATGTGTASPTNIMGSEAAEQVSGKKEFWALGATLAALVLAGGMS